MTQLAIQQTNWWYLGYLIQVRIFRHHSEDYDNVIIQHKKL